MASRKNSKEGEDFSELASQFEKETLRLCNQTYAATSKPIAADALRELVQRAESQIARFKELQDEYTGGRLEAIKEAGQQIPALTRFTETLKKKLAQ